MNSIEDFILWLTLCAIAPIALLLVYLLFVIMPVAFYADAECLRNGYPESRVTIGLERYCMNLDGSVTVKVEKL